jgi:hypothetical protein
VESFRGRCRLAIRWVVGACMACVVFLVPPSSVAATLPDGREYELASSGSDKDVMAETSRTRAADREASGLPMAAVFSSLGGFGDVRGTGIATEYLAQRTGEPGTSGWTVHGITPVQEPLTYQAILRGLDPVYPFFSSDLAGGVFWAWSPLTDAPNVAEVPNLYVRDDVRTAGAGSYELLTDAVTAQTPITRARMRPSFAGASSDLEHVVYESRLNLAADATGSNPKLYKADGGVVRLVRANGACPGQDPTFFENPGSPDAPCSVAGIAATALGFGTSGPRYTPRVISQDGSRVNFTSPFGNIDLVTPNTTPGVVSRLFQLDDRGTVAAGDDAVVQVNVSEKASPDDAQAAVYETASTDGSRVFFRSGEQLTDTAGSGLYMWERQATNETQSLVVDATGGSFTLTAHTQPSQGSGFLTRDSPDVFGIIGSFIPGQAISGNGIDPGTTVAAVAPDGTSITLSAPATVDGQENLTASIEATTDPLLWDATAAQVQAALEGLSIIGTGNVAVTGGPGASAPFTIEFTGALAGVNTMELTSDATGLSGGASMATVTTDNDVHNLTLIGPDASGVFGASEDGHRVYFASGGEVTFWQDADGTPGGTLSHVATLNPADNHNNQFPGPNTAWTAQPAVSRVTPDGRSLLFEASDGTGIAPGYQHGTCLDANANHSGNGQCSEVYVYRADSSTPSAPDVVCASCNLAVPGAPGDTFLNIRRWTSVAIATAYLNRALSDDGRYVFFDTSEALVPEDTNSAVDAYEYDVQSGQAHLLSSGTDPADSYFLDASADGHDAFFMTRAQLVGWDRDQAYDLYDARVGGGFPDPVQTADCSGDECQGHTPAAPDLAALGSRVFRGIGDLRPRLHRRAVGRKCRRGRVKRRVHRRVRCVKRKHAAGRHAQSVQRGVAR